MRWNGRELDTSLSDFMDERIKIAAANLDRPPEPPKPSRNGWDVLYHAIEVGGLVACVWALVGIVWLAK